MEAEWRPVCDDARPLGALPTVAAGDGAVLKVTNNDMLLPEFAQLRFVSGGGGGGEEMNLHTTEKSDLQVTII